MFCCNLAKVLTGLKIDTALAAERVVLLKEYPFITEASRLVDFIILDCSSNMLNFFTPTAIEAADLVVRIITPDLRGLNYLRAHKPLLTDEKFHYREHLTLASLARFRKNNRQKNGGLGLKG